MNVLFDENFGAPIIGALKSIVEYQRQPKPAVFHIFEKFPPGTADDEWIPLLAKDDWIVVSRDRGKKAPRLPQICLDAGVTHAVLSAAVHQASQFEKIRVVLSVWSRITALSVAPDGKRHQIRYSGPSRDHGRLD